ncbi:hypothetical protein NP493_1406g01044 [Ridgeia piscesae]|uniref:Integrin beta n=1 Tax=Ridgeia piscesae TaxID=27915 RepID=A0AAD9NBV4_RIDPI|nr:hypothetical protein NP493_1406g01044 [Ridgeia piscesae]
MPDRYANNHCTIGDTVVKLALLLSVFLVAVFAQSERGKQQNVCVEQATCGACVAAGSRCGWCTQDKYDKRHADRCDLIENLLPNGCDHSHIIYPNSTMSYDSNLNPQNAQDGQEAVQISPQEVTINLRPNTPYKMQVHYKQAENYPVDLYFVMDLSKSMEDDKNKLAELGDALSEKMSEITKNFRLGFGSFVDKKTMPYVSIIPAALKEPCTGCVAPYGFKNQLPLTDDTPQFRVKVIDADISGNLDSPEGGFDALMQAIVCKPNIGWRQASRKMLLFSTDAGFHIAGDGKLGGIVKPNDGVCHMDGNGFYSESLSQDYPSISQLSHKIAEKKVNIIFAVTKERLPLYRKLSELFEGSVVGELANDSSNIVELVRANYQKISGTVELKTEGDEDVEISFRTKCFGDQWREKASCSGLGIGQNVTYEVTIEVTSCPKDRTKWKKSFEIYPVGLEEKLTVNLNLMCECDCEKPGQEERNSPKCNNSGTFECGACTCNDNRYGKNCECDGSDLGSQAYDATCKMTNTSEVCEGKGQCVCGVCDCYPVLALEDPSKKYSGTYCQCDDYACDYSDGQLCGGPSRGKCSCGECICRTGFMGSACECPTSSESCIASNGAMCNGKGTCVCGKCICDLNDYYRGPTCEDCPTCPGRCEEDKPCVLCRAFQSGDLSEEYCDANCTHIEIVDSVEEKDGWKLCRSQDEDDCIFYFIYEYRGSRVQVQRTKECPEPVNIWLIILWVILGIILIGLACLLMWKIFVTIHDRREFAKFEKERQNAKWDMGENPIYKQATSTFKNPTYSKVPSQ